jgi:DNA-binding transcriptional LysR family regulator
LIDGIKTIRAMNLSSVNLNLLVALEALISEAHVGRAARKIGLSQPAASHALKQLRELLNDPLLVQVGSRMELTPRAVGLREPLAEALEQVRGLLVADHFDAASSSRRFSVTMADHVADLVIPSLVKCMLAEAPGVRLDVLPWQSPASMEFERLRSIDLLISCSSDELAGFERQTLFDDTEAVVIRRGHALESRMRNLRVFLNSMHVAVVGRGRMEDPVDTWLREEGVCRKIALRVPSYLQALHVVARTELVAFVPKRLAEALAKSLSLSVLEPPIDPGKYTEFLFYPRRGLQDPGSIWLRKRVVEIGEHLNLRAAA